MNASVIIPTHNRPKELLNAIQSVLNQTVLPKEIIVIDDNSTKLVDIDIDSKNVDIIYHRFSESQGACAARNKGVELSSSEIVMFLDDDDTWEPSKIEDQLNVFKRDSNIGLAYTGRTMVPESNRENTLYNIFPSKQGNCYPDILIYNFIGSTSSVAIRKELFIKLNGFDPNLPAMQDYDLWIRACKNAKVGHDGKANVRYTIADDPSKQISGNPGKYEKAGLYILEKYSSEIKSFGFVTRNKIKSHRYFSIAKTKRKKGFLPALYWILKSFTLYPNLKTLVLLLPPKYISKIRKATA